MPTEYVFDTLHSASQAKSTKTRPATSGGLSGTGASSKLTPSAREEDMEEKEDPASGQTSRRIACDICRGRKVRCDRVHPVCGRCRKLGHKCGYTTPRRQDVSKVNMSQTLLTLQERLAQTEARLALTQQALLTTPPTMPGRHLQQTDYFSMPPPSSSSGDAPFGYDVPGFLDFQGSLIDRTFDDWHQNGFGYDIDSLMEPEKFDFTPAMLDNHQYSAEVSSTNTDITNFDEELPQEEIQTLHKWYFDYIHAVIPMINRRRFSAELEHLHPRPEFMSLNYAIALFGAAASDEAKLEEKCYHFSRKYLALAEGDDEAAGFNSINMLQACILVAYYEFRRTSFARAWMSLGRAIRLCKMLGLHRMDFVNMWERVVDWVVGRLDRPATYLA